VREKAESLCLGTPSFTIEHQAMLDHPPFWHRTFRDTGGPPTEKGSAARIAVRRQTPADFIAANAT
jgi:hypothetical protein